MGRRRPARTASTTARSCSAASTSATCSSPSSRRGATATTRSRSTTRPTCRPPTTTSRSTAGSTRCGAPTRSCTSASTARSSGSRARRSRCRPAAGPTPPSATCPFFYPFVVNDPGEGAQAKRRTHAVVIDHLLPPMTRADTYDETGPARAALRRVRPAPGARPGQAARRCATGSGRLSQDAAIDRDLGPRPTRPDDGRLRRRAPPRRRLPLRAQGRPDPRRPAHPRRTCPTGETLVDLVLAITRLAHGRIPSLRARSPAELGLDPDRPARARRHRGARAGRSSRPPRPGAGQPPSTTRPTLGWICDWLVPKLRADHRRDRQPPARARRPATSPPGRAARSPAAAPTCCRRAGTSTPSTPRPCRPSSSWDVGCKLADGLLARHLDEEGTYPRTVGLVLWGTAVDAHPGRRRRRGARAAGHPPGVGDRSRAGSSGSRSIPLEELGRPRIDVTLRISGFFRDAFPNLVDLARRGRPPGGVARRAAPSRTSCAPTAPSTRGSTAPAPAPTASGILQLLEQRNWRSDDDLAAVYIAWSGYAYGREGFGVPAEDAMSRRFAAIDVAVKNQDNREHDIFDSDDYLQEHGGMIATIRSLTGRDPKAWFGDSANPARPVVRSLAEEAARVVRTRVVNPRWIEAMQRHGYKGAFEMAATVDYLFGYDATAHVVDDWMYEKVTAALRRRSRGAEVLRAVEPVGAALDRRAPARSGGAGHVGRQPRRARRAARRRARGRDAGRRRDDQRCRSPPSSARTTPRPRSCSPRRAPPRRRAARGARRGAAKTTLARGLAAPAARRRAVRRAAARRHRGPRARVARPRRAAHRRRRPLPARAARGGRRRRPLRRRDQPARRPPRRRAARRRGRRASTASSARASRTPTRPGSCWSASMNPEEGELRPQLLDRFGLAVDIEASSDPASRVKPWCSASSAPTTTRRRSPRTVEADDALRDRLRRPRERGRARRRDRGRGPRRPGRRRRGPARRPHAVPGRGRHWPAGTSERRRPTTTCGGWRRFVLAHRRRRTPFEEPGLAPDELDQAFERLPATTTSDAASTTSASNPRPRPRRRRCRRVRPSFTTPGRRARRRGHHGPVRARRARDRGRRRRSRSSPPRSRSRPGVRPTPTPRRRPRICARPCGPEAPATSSSSSSTLRARWARRGASPRPRASRSSCSQMRTSVGTASRS